jgi:Carboxypeptidase regulatory-like domain
MTRAWKRARSGVTLSRVQAVIGTLAGILSITGAILSWPFIHSAHSGQLVTTVQEAESHRRVPDATIEVLTPQNAIVATLSPDATGRATQDLNEGFYVVRVSHPRYAAQERRVQVQSRRTVEITANLRAGSSSSLQRIRRALGF